MAPPTRIENETRERLKRFGQKGESYARTYNDIIERLMRYFEDLKVDVDVLIEQRWERLQRESTEGRVSRPG